MTDKHPPNTAEHQANWFSRNPNETSLIVILALLVIGAGLGSLTRMRDDSLVSLFLTPENVRLMTQQLGMLGVIAIGAGIVIITGGIDLTIGALIALLGVIFFKLLTSWGSWLIDHHIPWHWSLAVLAVLITGGLFGLWHAYGITKLRMQAFIVTLCGLLSYRGIARFISSDSQVGNIDGLHETMDLTLLTVLSEGSIQRVLNHFTGNDITSGPLSFVPMSFIYLCIIAGIVGVFLHRSVYGRYLFAAGRNELAAKYSGINTHAVIGSAYVICGFCTAVSAILYAGFAGAVMPSGHGNFYELYAIAAAVLGGCNLRGGEGSVLGIVLGATILTVLQNMVQLFRNDTSLSDTIIGLILFVAVALMMKQKSFSLSKTFAKLRRTP